MEDYPVLGDIVTDYLQQYYTIHRAQEFIDEESYDLFIFAFQSAQVTVDS